MPTLSPPPRARVSAAAFTLESILRAHGRETTLTQYATEHYVATWAHPRLTLFCPARGGRFAVDEARRELRRIRPDAPAAPPEQVRALLGRIRVDPSPEPREMGGHLCRRLSFHNEEARVRIAGEVYCARVAGLEATALRGERELELPAQLVPLSPEPDEVVVLSHTRVLSRHFVQTHSLRLVDVARGVVERERFDRLLDYPVVA